MAKLDYLAQCKANAQRELYKQLDLLIKDCAEHYEANDAEARFVAAHLIAELRKSLKS